MSKRLLLLPRDFFMRAAGIYLDNVRCIIANFPPCGEYCHKHLFEDRTSLLTSLVFWHICRIFILTVHLHVRRAVLLAGVERNRIYMMKVCGMGGSCKVWHFAMHGTMSHQARHFERATCKTFFAAWILSYEGGVDKRVVNLERHIWQLLSNNSVTKCEI
jgi:hypothetical protein